NFQITDLPAGTYALALPEVSDALVTAPTVSVTTGQTLGGVSIQIRTGATISGRITQSTTQLPIAGLPVFLSGPAGVSQTTSDSNGMYQFPGLGAGDYRVYLPLGGAQTSQTVSVTGVDGTSATADLQLSYTGTISGTLMDSADNPITDGTVTLLSGGNPI